jgi:hypothetical protein
VLSGAGQWVTVVGGTGNISNINLNGNTFTFLNGGGQWANISTSAGTNVPNLNGNGSQVLAGNGAWVAATSGGNVGQLNLSGNANTVLSGTGSWRAIGNISSANLNGNTNTYLNGNGAWANIPTGITGASGSNSWVQYNAGGAFGSNSSFTFDVANSTLRSTAVSSDALLNLQYATENVSLLTIAQTGTYTLDVLSRSIHFVTANAISNLALAIRGSSTVSLNNLMAVGQCVTVVFMMTTGATGYIVNSFSIDGGAVVPKWSGGIAPTAPANSITAYSLSITKTASSTYTVIGSYSGYR